MTDKLVVFSTCASTEEARRVARGLVEKRLAACVNVLPGIRSFYRWNEAIQEDEEVLLLIKTSQTLFEDLKREIERLHSYEVPEVVALAIAGGSESYLNWLSGELAQEPS